MFFILSITTRTKVTASGLFRCPNDSGDRRYRHEQARRWFTVFFVPLIPLGTQDEWVRCEGCGVRYGVDVLARHPATGRVPGR